MQVEKNLTTFLCFNDEDRWIEVVKQLCEEELIK